MSHGLRSHLAGIKAQVSDVVHSRVVDALAYPQDKRAHRCFPLEADEFYYPAGRPHGALHHLEFSMFEGRTVESTKKLIRLLFERMERELGIAPMDVEITIFETPEHNWGIRGKPGDEHELNYRVDV